MTPLRSFAPWFALILMTACGGGTPEAKGVAATSDARDEAEAGTVTEVQTFCSDATCFDCGKGFCLAGWYCDEALSGGPACGWLPECVASNTCECVRAALGDCTCEERDGGVFVRCG